MFYWGFDDDLATIILVLSALCIYISYDITRVSKGAPRSWYLIIAAFMVLFVYRGFELYFDTQSPNDLINDWEALIFVLASTLLLAGLYTLDRTFRRHLEAADRGG